MPGSVIMGLAQEQSRPIPDLDHSIIVDFIVRIYKTENSKFIQMKKCAPKTCENTFPYLCESQKASL